MDRVLKERIPYCQKVLPLVYDESLSYYEAICKLVKKINEVVESIDNLETEVLTQANAYTDEAIQSAISSVDEAVREVEVLKNELQEQYSEFTRLTNAQLQIFNTRINAFDDEIKNAIIGVNARTDLAIQQNNDYIFEKIGEGLVDVKVVNFFTGEKVSVQAMFDYLSNLHVNDGIDYTTLASRNKTYNQLRDLHISYTDLVMHGNQLIV